MSDVKTSRRSPPARRIWEAQVLARLQQAAGRYTYARLSEMTGVHAESIRRYLTKGRPSAYFLATFCRTLGVSPAWLLVGDDTPAKQATPVALESKPRPNVVELDSAL